MVMRPRRPLAGRWIAGSRSTDAADQIFDLGRMWTEVGRHLVEVRIGDLLETGLIDITDDLDADRLQPGGRFMLERDSLGRLVLLTSSAAAWTQLFCSGERPLHNLSLTQVKLLFASCSVIDSTGATS